MSRCMLFTGTYAIEVSCGGHAVSASSSAYDINAVVVSTVSEYSSGEIVEFESKSSCLRICSNYCLQFARFVPCDAL